MKCRRRLSVRDLTLLPDRSSGLLVGIPYFAEVAASSTLRQLSIAATLCYPARVSQVPFWDYRWIHQGIVATRSAVGKTGSTARHGNFHVIFLTNQCDCNHMIRFGNPRVSRQYRGLWLRSRCQFVTTITFPSDPIYGPNRFPSGILIPN